MLDANKRWWLPALLLLALILVPACRQRVNDSTSTVPVTSDGIVAQPSSTAELPPTNTPVPTVEFKGVSFAFDEQVLGPLGEMAHLPPSPDALGAPMPEHLRISLSSEAGNDSALFVFPVAQYEALSTEAAAEIEALQTLLQERPKAVTGDLPLLPMIRAVQTYHSEPKYLDFVNGGGISYIARADHDHSLATDEAFFYTFQGITDNGAYYIAAFVPLAGRVEAPQEPLETASANNAGERQAKTAINGDWIGQEVGSGNSLVDGIMLSLEVEPGSNFPHVDLPDYLTTAGFFMGYEIAESGEAHWEHLPAVIKDHNGESTYLTGVPDILTISFEGEDRLPVESAIQVQALRDDEGNFFSSIPDWQQQLAHDLNRSTFLPTAQDASEVDTVEFQNGSGTRWIALDGEGNSTYHFRGLSEGGRFLIRVDFPIAQSGQSRQMTYLDRLVGSVLVTSDAGARSSVPPDPNNCTYAAEFIEDVTIPDDTEIERGDEFVKIWRVRNSGTCTWTPANTVQYAQGNPLEWQALSLTKVVMPGEESEVGISAISPAQAGTYEAWWQLSEKEGTHFGDLLGLRFVAPRPATDIPSHGVIEGSISYPANGNPAIDIYFLSTDGSERYSMRTEPGWTQYANTIPVGTYYVFGRVAGDNSESGGGYTQAVICGLHAGCTDHSLVEVNVEEGRASHSVNIADWYAPEGSFPLPDNATSAE